MQIGRVGVGDLLLGVFVDARTTWWWVIIAVLALGILSLFAPKRRGRRRRKFRRENPRRTPPSHTEASRSDASRLGDPKAQMEFISKVDFEPLRLLNRSEYRILQILEKVTREIGERHRVMAQTSLGEIIAPRAASASENERDLAFRSINSKRLDFLIIDRTGMPSLAVEYQGHGHYQNRAFMRDAVKREAVRRASIKFLEIPAEYDATLVETQVRSALLPGPTHGPGTSITSWDRVRRSESVAASLRWQKRSTSVPSFPTSLESTVEACDIPHTPRVTKAERVHGVSVLRDTSRAGVLRARRSLPFDSTAGS